MTYRLNPNLTPVLSFLLLVFFFAFLRSASVAPEANRATADDVRQRGWRLFGADRGWCDGEVVVRAARKLDRTGQSTNQGERQC